MSHSRDALLHEQYVTGAYWTRHGLPKQEVPARMTTIVKRLRAIGPPDTKPWQALRDALILIPAPGEGIEVPHWPNHLFIPGARTYAKHNGSPLDMPSKTIKAGVHGVAGGEAMLRNLDGSVRYLTVREAAMVQGFPQDYEFPGPRSRVMGVIGNAVATHVAATLGRALRKHTGI
jgi:DNA (cytosine-5)-methyltransferase 1